MTQKERIMELEAVNEELMATVIEQSECIDALRFALEGPQKEVYTITTNLSHPIYTESRTW